MSAHHYFADFACCDSGMIPWLLIIELMSLKKAPLSALVGERQRAYPCSGEINYPVRDIPEALARVEKALAPVALKKDSTDGLSLKFPTWRLNLRGSNTEPLLRLNLETRGDQAEVGRRLAEVEFALKGKYGG
jgi:phosphomannomutase